MQYLPIFVFIGFVWSATPFSRLQLQKLPDTEPTVEDSYDIGKSLEFESYDFIKPDDGILSGPVLNGTWKSPLRYHKLLSLSEADQPKPAKPSVAESSTSAAHSQSSHSNTSENHNIGFIEKAFDLIYKQFWTPSVLEVANALPGEKDEHRPTCGKGDPPIVGKITVPTTLTENSPPSIDHTESLRTSSADAALGTSKSSDTKFVQDKIRKMHERIGWPCLPSWPTSFNLPKALRVGPNHPASSGIVEVEVIRATASQWLHATKNKKPINSEKYHSSLGIDCDLLGDIDITRRLVHFQAYFKPRKHDNYFLWYADDRVWSSLWAFGAPLAEFGELLVFRQKLDPRFHYRIQAQISIERGARFSLALTDKAAAKKVYGRDRLHLESLMQHFHLPTSTGEFGLADGLSSGVRHDQPLPRIDTLVLPFKRPWWCPPSNQTGQEIIYSNSKDILCFALPGRVMQYTAWIHLDVAYNFIITAKDRTQLIIDLGENVGNQKKVFTLESADGGLTTGVLDEAPGYYQATVKTWAASSKPTFFITMCDVKNSFLTKAVTFYQFPDSP